MTRSTTPRRHSTRKVALVLGVTAAVGLGTAGAAFAYWTAQGGGSGKATTASSDATLVVTQDDVTGMYPGDSAKPVVAKVTNSSGTQKAYFSSLTAALAVSKGGAAVVGCDATDYLINGHVGSSTVPEALTVSSPTELDPHGVRSITTSIQFNDKATANQDACQGALVTITYVAG